MISFIKGALVERTPTHVVVEAGGVGYFINISLYTYNKIPESGNIKIFTHLNIKEDAHTLYGFADEEERGNFRHLITVSGVGAGTARIILSSLPPDEFRNAIIQGDVALLKSVKGIGAKTAQRILIDLQDKFRKSADETLVSSHFEKNRVKDEALSAMVTLGFPAQAAEKTLTKIMREKGQEVSLEELIRMALKAM